MNRSIRRYIIRMVIRHRYGRCRYLIYGRLVLVEVDTLEGNYHEAFLSLLEVFADCEVAVFDEFLFHKAVFLVELVDTAVGDVLDHLLGQVCCLCFGGFLGDLASLVGFLFGEPALCDVG